MSGGKVQAGGFIMGACLFLGVGVAGIVAAGPALPAGAAPQVLFASAAGAGTACSPAASCSLPTALGQVVAGGTIELTSPGPAVYATTPGHPFAVTRASSTAAPITIQPAAGVVNPTLSGGSNGLVLTVGSGVTLRLVGVLVEDGTGGTILNQGALTIARSSLFSNTNSNSGGALSNLAGGSLVVTDSTFTGNGTGQDGGAIANTGTATIIGSTFSQNAADGISGGAFFNAGALTVNDSTFSGNTAQSAGGAIENTGTLTVTASTFSRNADAGTAPDIDRAGGGTTVAADIFAGGCGGAGSITDLGFNVGSNVSCQNGGPQDQTGGVLAPLSQNGGATSTIVPGAGSPALGLIPNQKVVGTAPHLFTLCPTTDQRNIASPAGQNCDAGSVQVAGRATQTVSFSTTPPALGPLGGSYAPAATASSGLPVTISIAKASAPVCSFFSGLVFFDGPGTCTIEATQPGTPLVVPAQASQSFLVSITRTAGAFVAGTPDGHGDWLATPTGTVFAFGDAGFFGSVVTQHLHLNKLIVGIAATPDGRGYWLVASDGGVFTFGDAKFHGSAGSIRLNQPIVGMTSTPDGKGYYLVATDGGIFTYGDAHFQGSLGNKVLNQPVFGMTTSPDGKGYYLVAKDGGVFTFGDARFKGSTGGQPLASPVIGIATNPTGTGYWLIEQEGHIFNFGGTQVFGQVNPPTRVVGLVISPDGLGYTVVAANGTTSPFGDGARF